MFKYKKKRMIVFLSTTLICLCIMLLLCDGNTENKLMSTKTVVSNTKSTALEDIEKEEDTNSNKGEEQEENDTEEQEEITDTVNISNQTQEVQEVVETEPVVYEGMTLNDLASKLERSMKNELSGYGYLYASYSLEKGVDPYLALAISLEETGCNWKCSSLVKNCHNVGGMKGSGCGAYGYFNNLDEGIRAFIDNIARNYVAYGLTTADTMNSKYAENPAWSTNVNNYITRIRNN